MACGGLCECELLQRLADALKEREQFEGVNSLTGAIESLK